jgi:SAM-dependent methyltransferase
MSSIKSWFPPGPNPHLRFSSAARRWFYRSRVDEITLEIMKKINLPEFNEKFSDNPKHKDLGGKGSSKYISLEYWLRVAVERFFAYNFFRLPSGSRILDIGCGSGYFLMAGKYLGYDMTGLDLDLDALYNEQIEFFGLRRINHYIKPGDYLPEFGSPFDLITGFMTGFNEYMNGKPWGEREWSEFLPILRRGIRKRGTAFFAFNRNDYARGYYTTEVCRAIKSCPHFKARFFANCLQLSAL